MDKIVLATIPKEIGDKLIENIESTHINNKLINDSESMLKELLSNRENSKEVLSEERYCTIEESLEQSLKEMKLMREGKIPKKTWRELRAEMNKW